MIKSIYITLILTVILTFAVPASAVLVSDYSINTGGFLSADTGLIAQVVVNDLLSGQTASITGGYHSASLPASDADRTGTLTDGTFSLNGVTVIVNDNSVAGEAMLVTEYTASVGTTWSIYTINIFSGHQGDGGRVWINALVEIDTTGSSYSVVTNMRTGAFGQTIAGLTDSAAVVRLYDNGGAPFATGVRKVKLSFFDVSHSSTGTFKDSTDNSAPENNFNNQGPILKEIDVLGLQTNIPDWQNY